MNTPKKIWFDQEECSAGPVQFYDDEILYIRADIVDELVEALKYCLQFNGHAFMYDDTKAQAALAKLEESHD